MISNKQAKENISKKLEEYGYSFDGDFEAFEYIGYKKTYIPVICDKGHHYKVIYPNLINKSKCYICHKIKVSKYTSNTEAKEKIKESLEHRGYKFDGDFDKFIYVNSKMIINLLDEKGEKINLLYDSLTIKSKYKNKTENRKAININIKSKLKKTLEDNNYTFIGSFNRFFYKKINMKITVKCERGHQNTLSINYFIKNNVCRDCKKENSKRLKKPSNH